MVLSYARIRDLSFNQSNSLYLKALTDRIKHLKYQFNIRNLKY
ncbi:hypothetical protein ADICYQ_3153 [Cyclobacterium qasimii M12-11B]|uniref:Uncharacterized protein n=1 Tax=Cyclobacterium qasimii M12-11B TaxID=641524 RepID=S7VDY2_9BACT|nr:hypothetical protein ADICYQ_3153 [Cyclobacterium qasimii M12-11B]